MGVQGRGIARHADIWVLVKWLPREARREAGEKLKGWLCTCTSGFYCYYLLLALIIIWSLMLTQWVISLLFHLFSVRDARLVEADCRTGSTKRRKDDCDLNKLMWWGLMSTANTWRCAITRPHESSANSVASTTSSLTTHKQNSKIIKIPGKPRGLPDFYQYFLFGVRCCITFIPICLQEPQTKLRCGGQGGGEFKANLQEQTEPPPSLKGRVQEP